ncbi:MAG: hypothetical protein AAF628_05360 [Planctomycetota bacterium]
MAIWHARWSLPFTLFPALIGPAAAQGYAVEASDLTEVAAPWSAALGLELTNLRATSAPGADVQAKVAASAGGAHAVNKAVVYQADFSSQRPVARGKLRLCRIPATAGGTLLIGLDDGGTLRGAAWLDDAGEARPEWQRFFAQFRRRELLAEMVGVTAEEFANRRERAASGASDADRLTHALIQQRTQMVAILEPFMDVVGTWQTQQELDQDGLMRVVAAFERYADQAPALRPLLGDDVDRYAELARRAGAEFVEFGEAIENGDDPMPVIQRSRQSCTECHQLDVKGDDRGLQKTAIALRTEHGVGTGVFALGYDVITAGHDPQEAQTAATDLRRAVLLLLSLPQPYGE